jgi:GT2 family glycosyltransferase
MSQKAILDIIIVNYNSTEFLIKSLASVYQSLNGRRAHVHVIDNDSVDHVERIKARFPDVHLTVNRNNRGFSAAANQGLQDAQAPFVMLLNPDTIVTKGFFDEVLNYMEKHPRIGVLGPRIINPDGSLQGSARSFPDLLTPLFARTSPLTRFFPNNRISRRNILTLNSDGETPMRVDWVAGACMLVRSEAIKVIGHLDERFFMYWEDADWCRRMRDHGWQVVYYPAAMVFHHVGASSSSCVFKSVFRFHQSTERLFKKYSQPGLRFVYPFTLVALMLRMGLAFLMQLIRRFVKSHIPKSKTYVCPQYQMSQEPFLNRNDTNQAFRAKSPNPAEKNLTESLGHYAKVVDLNQRRLLKHHTENDASAVDGTIYKERKPPKLSV